jgi:hypothetical protein
MVRLAEKPSIQSSRSGTQPEDQGAVLIRLVTLPGSSCVHCHQTATAFLPHNTDLLRSPPDRVASGRWINGFKGLVAPASDIKDSIEQ